MIKSAFSGLLALAFVSFPLAASAAWVKGPLPDLPYDCDSTMVETNRRAVIVETKEFGVGSGALVNNKYLLTAAHVIKSGNHHAAKIVVKDPHGRWEQPATVVRSLRVQVALGPSKNLPKPQLALDDDLDLALLELKVAEPALAKLPKLKVASEVEPQEMLVLASTTQHRLVHTRVETVDDTEVTTGSFVVRGDSGSGVFSCVSGALIGLTRQSLLDTPEVDPTLVGTSKPQPAMELPITGFLATPQQVEGFLVKYLPAVYTR